MMIHDITGKAGKYKTRKRVGRGRSSGVGKTSGRGHKGAGQRSGHSHRAAFEGGQMTFARRIPKRGFTNAAFRRNFHVVNLKSIEARFDAGATVDAAALLAAGLVRDESLPIKVLGEGDLAKKLTVVAAKFSAGAKRKIEEAGGTATEAAGTATWKRDRSPEAMADLKARRAKVAAKAKAKAAAAKKPSGS